MAKGYWIVSVDISNPESHKMYIAETRTAFRRYGARFVIRGGKSEVLLNFFRSSHVRYGSGGNRCPLYLRK
jgi:uncharacterized protein (DUF1330 family)